MEQVSSKSDGDHVFGRRLVSIRGYSDWRREKGLPCSLSTIVKAIQTGRISRSCAEHVRCPVDCRRGKIDPEAADLEWTASTDPTRQRHHQRPEALVEAKEAEAMWRARRARLTFEREAGQLGRVSVMQEQVFRVSRAVRDAVLLVPRRVVPRLGLEPKVQRKVETAFYDELCEVLRKLDELIRRES